MSLIDIRRTHTLAPGEVRAAIDEIASSLAGKFRMDCTWHDDALCFSRPGVAGNVAFTAQEIRLQARLGLAMRPLKPLIEREIERYLDERLG
jgi:putative polyhydroxyalkanoate system protein